MKNLVAYLLLLLSTTSLSPANDKDKGSFYHLYQTKSKTELHTYWDQEISLYQVKEGNRVLDVGGSDGKLIVPLAMVCDSVDYFLEDINPQNLAYDVKFMALAQKVINPKAHFGLHQITGTDSTVGATNGSFERIVVRETFHHFDYPKQMVKEFNRLLAPGGLLIISEPSNQKEFKNCKLIAPEQLIQMVEGEGFKNKSRETTATEFTVFVFAKN